MVPEAGALHRRLTAAAEVRAGVDAGLTLPALHAEHDGSLFSPLAELDLGEQVEVQGWDADIALLLDELVAARSATRVVPLPGALSASDLVRLAADEDAFVRALARPVPAAPIVSARRGTRFHAWVETHFGARPLLAPDDLPGAADEGIDDDSDLAAMREAFLAGPVRRPYPRRRRGAVLAGARRPGGARPHRRGVLDRHRRGAAYEVVDWKTSTRQVQTPCSWPSIGLPGRAGGGARRAGRTRHSSTSVR